jgi:mono/diheme cytochrome c family protein
MKLRPVLLAMLSLLGAGVLGAAGFVWSGVYDISATSEHTQPVYDLLEGTMRQSVRRHARDVQVPDLRDPALLQRGALCFRDKCAQCHGAPGVAMGEIGRSMQPLPGPLIDATRHWKARELYWITRHGIKMSGMPAWEYRLPDADLWALVAFLMRLPDLSVEGYRALTGAAAGPPCETPPIMPGSAPDPERGRVALHQHACNSCHVIPGVTGPEVHVGPPLKGLASRQLIAGAVPNTAEHMVRWIREPTSVDPRTAMPALGVSERDARDMEAYLATLE